MNAVVGDIFHQRRVNGLLFFHAAQLAKHFTYGNYLKVAAVVAHHVDFVQRQRFHQHGLNFTIFHCSLLKL